MAVKKVKLLLPLVVVSLVVTTTVAQSVTEVKAGYNKTEQLIKMRDGARLFTAIYSPKDKSKKYPLLLSRTPYSVAPYGPDQYKSSVGPSLLFEKEKFIFVYQDVRGRFMSEGEFVNVRPHNPHKGVRDVDESSDTYDTIEWLVKNVPNNNGRVGMWGISYPGFYAAMGIIDAHPALKATSPQAPIADWFIGDDFHHNGAFFLPHSFNFFASFGQPRPRPTTEAPPRFSHGTPDGYSFFLELGPLKNADERYLKGNVEFWKELLEHPNYDDFWQARTTLPHFKNVKPAVMTVGGWFDAEDLYGALNTYKSIERLSPGIYNTLVMGPWFHGGWSRADGDFLGDIRFGSKTAVYYREKFELPFFNCLLKQKCDQKLPEALVFETGSNEWRMYPAWPPSNIEQRSLYFQPNGKLSLDAPKMATQEFDQYVNDPSKPVPYIDGIAIGMTREYMVGDQRFASRRPDVLVYSTEPLKDNFSVAGPITATLYISTTGTDADYIVKLIDVFPDDTPDNDPNPGGVRMGGYQMLVRGEPMRARFRKSFTTPEALMPNQIAKVEFIMPDVNHAFLKGHRIMVQVQSSWFPLVDRNPQSFVDIGKAVESDFQTATHRIYRAGEHQSRIIVNVLR